VLFNDIIYHKIAYGRSDACCRNCGGDDARDSFAE